MCKVLACHLGDPRAPKWNTQNSEDRMTIEGKLTVRRSDLQEEHRELLRITSAAASFCESATCLRFPTHEKGQSIHLCCEGAQRRQKLFHMGRGPFGKRTGKELNNILTSVQKFKDKGQAGPGQPKALQDKGANFSEPLLFASNRASWKLQCF